MKEFISKAAVLIEALPYIQRLKGKKIVIKYGGSVIGEDRYCRSVLRDVVFMRTVGMHPILVHGGGKTITARLEKENIPSTFIHGLRVTDPKTMEIVQDVLRHQLSKHIAGLITEFGATPVIQNGLDHGIIQCVRKTEYMGEPIDLGFVGEITSIQTDVIENACAAGQIPVIAPIGVDSNGQPYNINADNMAGELSAALNAQKLVYLSDIPGILKDISDPATLISSLKQSEVTQLIQNKVIQGGMIPKISACLKSLEAGSRKTHIVDGRMQHSLLLEIFTDKGVGTEIVHD